MPFLTSKIRSNGAEGVSSGSGISARCEDGLRSVGRERSGRRGSKRDAFGLEEKRLEPLASAALG